jgi:hypothetical protein
MRKAKNSDTLEGVLAEIWSMLKYGANSPFDPFHWPVLGTSGTGGCSVRTVILRQFILPGRILVCHTDARAVKVQEIRHHDSVTWLFYHPKKKVQLRASGRATLHSDDPFADEQWAGSKLTSRLNYCAVEPPGTPVDRPTSGLPGFLRNRVPTLFETEKGRENFLSIACRIDTLDWLKLSVLGNRRARFVWEADRLTATWLVP